MVSKKRNKKSWVVVLLAVGMLGVLGAAVVAGGAGTAMAAEQKKTTQASGQNSGSSATNTKSTSKKAASSKTSTRKTNSISTLEGGSAIFAPAIATKEGMEIPTAVWGKGVERVKAATKVYGLLAMQMQRTYGVPWEVLIAQMQVESQIGQTGAARGGTNNWLGITGKGDAGRSGRYAKFSSVEASIQAWAQKVIRNGLYNEAMWHTDPDKWNLRDFLANMVHVYAPASDGNDEAGYVRDVLSIINKMVKPAREEMGWPSSEELAKSERIAVGGIYPIGSAVGSELVKECTEESGAGAGAGQEVQLLKKTNKNQVSAKSSSRK